MIELLTKIFTPDKFDEIVSRNGADLFFTGLYGSLKSFVISYLYQSTHKKIIFCCNDSSILFNLKEDINCVLGEETALIYLSEYDEEFENDVNPLSDVLKKLSFDEKLILLLEPSVFDKSIISEESFRNNLIKLNKDRQYKFDELVTKLNEFNFKRKQIVEDENEFAVRGGIIDVFPENLNQPVRIEFFGDTIESIREFDIITQRSISQLSNVEILPSLQEIDRMQSQANRLIDYVKEDVLMLIDEPDIVKNEHELIFEKILRFPNSYFSIFPLVKSEALAQNNSIKEITFNSKPQPSFHSNIKLLYKDLKDLSEKDFDIFITSSDEYQTKRFKELLEDIDENNELRNISYFNNSVHEGFVLPYDKIAVYMEHEVFERYFRPAKRKRKFAGITFKDLSKVNFGDAMVHHNYGIGKYAGLKKIKVGGVEQEAVKLLYQDNDVLFVNLNSLHYIKKYSAQEGHKPKLSKLGGNEWERIKQRTKKKIQEIAHDLIMLYSKRKSIKGYKFSADTVWQKELEASFIYEDTPDQITATEDIKMDMESENPMDRLICGDVGFGKTEVAVRAAFKCVLENKQAAVLVPTTVLAEQHYNTFKDRLSNWAVEVEHLSRFKNKKQQKDILEKLKYGKINIIIGTHRLLSKDVGFKDLGLLVIDEEQRFGVKAKEKMKMMKEIVDVLTLTATPIPRTLNFSLLGARDLSIINTPPKNRQSIHTEIINFSKNTIASAVIRELQRGGQVYFVNDKISKLEELASIIEELVPYAKVAIAHGQMNAHQLENVMMKFLEKKYDVLMCTKIIESGLDIPSVNTIFINRADNFGLAELYQLRGRVGRSNIKSYAYLITPPHSSLTKQAIRRLHALEEFTELGSGMNLALRDLEIRGAGNLLGKEQSGFISELGFDTYMQILDEAVKDLKLETGLIKESVSDEQVIIESDVSAFIPEYYIEDENTRLDVYQRLSGITSFKDVESVKLELLDRFGKFPEEVESLIRQVELKILSSGLGFERINIHKDKAEFYFSLNDNELFSSRRFENIMNYLSERNSSDVKLLQTKKSLMLKYNLEHSDHSIEKLEEVCRVMEEIKQIEKPEVK